MAELKTKTMRSRKYLWNLLTLLMVAMLSVNLTACGDDDDDDTPTIVSPVVGSWKTSYYTSSFGADLYLGSDGTVRLSITNNGKTSASKGTYETTTTNDGILKLYFDDEETPEFWEYLVSDDGKTMTTTSLGGSSSLTWTKQ